jgi:hypothetical protein
MRNVSQIFWFDLKKRWVFGLLISEDSETLFPLIRNPWLLSAKDISDLSIFILKWSAWKKNL